ncbi:MAG: hypothetical protein SGILL_009708 [Bacillariaceae sp.]
MEDISLEKRNEFCQHLLESIAMEQLGDYALTSFNYEKAMTHYNNALALECNAIAYHALDTADLQVKIAECMFRIGDVDSSMEELRHAARKYEQHILLCNNSIINDGVSGTVEGSKTPATCTLGSPTAHSFIGEIHSKTAAIYLTEKKYEEALGEYAKASFMFQECLGKSHSRSREALADMKVVTVTEMEHLRQEERRRKKLAKNKQLLF